MNSKENHKETGEGKQKQQWNAGNERFDVSK